MLFPLVFAFEICDVQFSDNKLSQSMRLENSINVITHFEYIYYCKIK